MTADTPERFGRYELGRLLGRGGYGEVYLAYDTERSNRAVAVKRLSPDHAMDDESVARFRREAELAAGMTDHHIIPIHDYGVIDGQFYLEMRLVEDGIHLRSLIDRERRLAPRRAVSIVRQIASALDSAHRTGLVHRDVKPENVLVLGRPGATGDQEFVYLIDFGIANSLKDSRLTTNGFVVGTAAYLAPERFDPAESGDLRVDVYALGCVLHEALTGRPPLSASSLTEWSRVHRHAPPPPLDPGEVEFADGLSAVIARALAKDPDARYRSAGQLAAAAEAVVLGTTEPDQPALDPSRPESHGPGTQGEEATGAGTPGPDARGPAGLAGVPTGGEIAADTGERIIGGTPRPARRPDRRRLVVAGATALVVLLAGTAFVLTRGPAEPSGPPPASANAFCAGSKPATGAAGLPAPLPVSTADLPRGPVIYQAPMDGNAGCLVDLVGQAKDPDREAVRHLPGRIELAALRPNADARFDLAINPGVTDFIQDLGISVAPSSNVRFVCGLRWAVQGKLAYELYVDTAADFAQLSIWNGNAHVPITPRQPISFLHSGRVVPITVALAGGHLGLWIDGVLRAEANDTQVPPAATSPGFDVYSKEGTGTVTIHRLSLYALPPQ